MNGVSRRVSRLARKPPGYVARRALQEIGREAQRLKLARAARGRGPLAAGRAIPGGMESALEATAESMRSFANFAGASAATASDPYLLARVVGRARRAKVHALQLFGDEPVSLPAELDWNVDPRSGQRWPLGHHRRLDFRDLGNDSDVKVTWEMSRLRHCVHLAQAAALGDDDAQDVLERDLEGWRRHNPLGWSVNWTCAMEVALRAANVICVDGTLLAAGRRLPSRRELVGSLYQHGWFLFRNLEISDLNGNHFLADGVGLVWLGRYFRGIGEAPRWYERGLDMVREAAREQILPDGLDHEGSLPYHLLVCELLLAARAAAGDDLRDLDGVVARLLDVAVAVSNPDGRVPDLGDNDGGRALAFGDGGSCDARRVLALGGTLLGHAEAAAMAGAAEPEDALWLAGPPSDANVRPRAARTGTLLKHGGVALLGNGDDHVVVDVGPIGFRGRGGHGHVDALSFEVVIGGSCAVRDSGTGSYTGNAPLRNRLRDAWAHSLVVLDGLPYARIGDEQALWSISGDSPPTVEEFAPGSQVQRLVAVQALPARGGSGVVRRTFEWRPGQLEVEDRVRAPSGSAVAALLQLPVGCTRTGGASLASRSHSYKAEVPDGSSLSLETCERSRRYGSVESGTRAVVRLKSRGGEVRIKWRIQRC